VPLLEPKFISYLSITQQIQIARDKFGDKRHLCLLDNNVFASKKHFNQIIDDIIAAGFGKGATYLEPNHYQFAFANQNVKGIQKLLIEHKERLQKATYHRLLAKRKTELDKLTSKDLKKQYIQLFGKPKQPIDYTLALLEHKEKLLQSNNDKKLFAYQNKIQNYSWAELQKRNQYFSKIFDKYYKTKKPVQRYVDFNQGLDARLLVKRPELATRLSEINIRPARLAFDEWTDELITAYTQGIQLLAENGISHLSNYLLYNFHDKPLDLYKRLSLTIELSDKVKCNDNELSNALSADYRQKLLSQKRLCWRVVDY
jgi:hypothetical protein